MQAAFAARDDYLAFTSMSLLLMIITNVVQYHIHSICYYVIVIIIIIHATTAVLAGKESTGEG